LDPSAWDGESAPVASDASASFEPASAAVPSEPSVDASASARSPDQGSLKPGFVSVWDMGLDPR